MAKHIQRVLIVGQANPTNLESSYRRAFELLGCEVATFDLTKAVDRHCRLGRFGRFLNTFLPVETWVRKANRDLVLQAIEFRPGLLVVIGQQPIRVGALAQIKASAGTRLVFVWPDTLLNLQDNAAESLPLFDLIGTYSQSNVKLFSRLGAEHVIWLPLAGDPDLHPVTPDSEPDRRRYAADVTFIGGWRPEREKTLTKLGAFDLKIWGPDWDRRCKGNPTIRKAWQGRPLFSKEFSRAVSNSKINLNVIDPTNYPAANMRFFEIPTAGGLQVSSACPEMETEFRDNEHVVYYQDPAQLPGLIESLRTSDKFRLHIASAGHDRVMKRHTYRHRAETLLEQLNCLCNEQQFLNSHDRG